MQERALRKVLLIQAIEETDRNGEALPLGERAEATRSVMGNNFPTVETQAETTLPTATEGFLVRRAEVLLDSLRARSPGIDHVLEAAGGGTALDRGLLVGAFIVGGVLSLLDGTGGINIFALPLLALLVWNLMVYLWMLSRARKGDAVPRATWFGNLYANRVRKRIDGLLSHSTGFNAPLAPGLRRFAADWWDLARPLFYLRARRLLHLCAVVVTLGLIVGYYIRGFLFRSAAGWEGGDVLGPETAHALLVVLYVPAALLLGITIPAAPDIAKLEWSAPSLAGVGEPAIWLHLIAATAVLYIVLPRLIATVVTSASLWRLTRRLTPPPGLVGYVRTLFAAVHQGAPLA